MRVWSLLALFACSEAPIEGTPDAAPADTSAEARRDAGSDAGWRTPDLKVKGPLLLSETGLYANLKARALAPGVMAFAPRWELWSDAAEKARWAELPPGAKIDTSDMNQWSFPVGTKLWKEFRYQNRAVETRFLWKVEPGGWDHWWMVSYRWRADGSDADAVVSGEPDALGTGWKIPTQVQCIQCHFGVRDVGIGFSALQLSAPKDSQLAKLAALGLLTAPPKQEWDAPGAGAERDALAYLHANCGHCHVESSPLFEIQSKLVLRLRLSDSTPKETGAYAAIGMMARHAHEEHGFYNIVAGQPEKSQLWIRMGLRDYWAMPPIGTSQVDPQGTQLVGDWIRSLP